MQADVDKWEAAGFLGMSVEMLDRVYGHHHPKPSQEYCPSHRVQNGNLNRWQIVGRANAAKILTDLSN